MNSLPCLSIERTLIADDIHSKKQAFERLSLLLAQDMPGLSENQIFECLLSREKIGSTGLGDGVALPHGRTENCTQMLGAALLLKQPIDYNNGEKVDILFALIVPDPANEEHHKCLAYLAKHFHDDKRLSRIRHAYSDQALYDIITEQNEHITS